MTSNHLLKRSLINRLNKLSNKRKNQEGFTLIEILTVVIIVGILSALVIPAMLNQQATARVNAANDAAMNAARACAQLQVTNRQSDFILPDNVSGGTDGTVATDNVACLAEGNTVVFATTTPATLNIDQAAKATITTAGEVSLTQCAQKTGVWAPTNAPYCNN